MTRTYIRTILRMREARRENHATGGRMTRRTQTTDVSEYASFPATPFIIYDNFSHKFLPHARARARAWLSSSQRKDCEEAIYLEPRRDASLLSRGSCRDNVRDVALPSCGTSKISLAEDKRKNNVLHQVMLVKKRRDTS